MQYTVKFKTDTRRNRDVDELLLNVRVSATSETEAEARAYNQLITYGYMNQWMLTSVEEDK